MVVVLGGEVKHFVLGCAGTWKSEEGARSLKGFGSRMTERLGRPAVQNLQGSPFKVSGDKGGSAPYRPLSLIASGQGFIYRRHHHLAAST
jgi:hypothetical protein